MTDQPRKSNVIPFRPQRVHITADPETVKVEGEPGYARDWVINDIKIGNVSMIPRTRLGRLWRRIARIWWRLTRRFRKPPKTD